MKLQVVHNFQLLFGAFVALIGEVREAGELLEGVTII